MKGLLAAVTRAGIFVLLACLLPFQASPRAALEAFTISTPNLTYTSFKPMERALR